MQNPCTEAAVRMMSRICLDQGFYGVGAARLCRTVTKLVVLILKDNESRFVFCLWVFDYFTVKMYSLYSV